MQKRQDRLDWQQVNDSRAEARRMLNEAERNLGGSAPQTEAPPPTRPAVAGDTVELVSMGTKATVLSVNKDGSLQLQAGILKISAKQEEVRVVEGETRTQREARKIVARAQHTRRRPQPDRPAGHDDRRGHLRPGALFGHGHDGQAGDGDHHPR